MLSFSLSSIYLSCHLCLYHRQKEGLGGTLLSMGCHQARCFNHVREDLVTLQSCQFFISCSDHKYKQKVFISGMEKENVFNSQMKSWIQLALNKCRNVFEVIFSYSGALCCHSQGKFNQIKMLCFFFIYSNAFKTFKLNIDVVPPYVRPHLLSFASFSFCLP